MNRRVIIGAISAATVIGIGGLAWASLNAQPTSYTAGVAIPDPANPDPTGPLTGTGQMPGTGAHPNRQGTPPAGPTIDPVPFAQTLLGDDVTVDAVTSTWTTHAGADGTAATDGRGIRYTGPALPAADHGSHGTFTVRLARPAVGLCTAEWSGTGPVTTTIACVLGDGTAIAVDGTATLTGAPLDVDRYHGPADALN